MFRPEPSKHHHVLRDSPERPQLKADGWLSCPRLFDVGVTEAPLVQAWDSRRKIMWNAKGHNDGAALEMLLEMEKCDSRLDAPPPKTSETIASLCRSRVVHHRRRV